MDRESAAELNAISDELEAQLAAALRSIRRIADHIEQAPDGLVPYRSQWENDAARFRSDCGPACVAMLVQHVTRQRISIDQVSVECGLSETHKNTFPDDLIRGAAAHGVKLACLIVTSVVMVKTPGIALIHYDALPRMDVGYTRGHWVVVCRVGDGQVIYHDPDWWGTRIAEGEGRSVTIGAFDQAMKDCQLDGNPQGLVLVIP